MTNDFWCMQQAFPNLSVWCRCTKVTTAQFPFPDPTDLGNRNGARSWQIRSGRDRVGQCVSSTWRCLELFALLSGETLRTDSRLHVGANSLRIASAHSRELVTARALLTEKAGFSGLDQTQNSPIMSLRRVGHDP